VKCSGGNPCFNCNQAGKEIECKYPRRDRQIKVSQRYVEELLKENELLRDGCAKPDAGYEHIASELFQNATEALETADDAGQNPLFGGRPWFHPVASLDMPIHIDLAADAAFATRFRQTLTGDSSKHIPRMSFVSDDVILSLSETECQWPSPARARFLVRVALGTVCRCYHMVRRSVVMRSLETALQNHGNSNRLTVSKLFALFALGELYATKTALANTSFPGLLFFSRAKKLVTVPAERPQGDTMEIILLLVCQTPFKLTEITKL
jgi:proline utilization trans-activator